MSEYTSFQPDSLTVADRQRLLTMLVAPRPIAFVSTVDAEGNVNLSPFSFFNVFSANPPVLIFSPARRGRDNTTKHSYENLKEVPEACVSVINYAMVQQISLASTEYEKGVNEFIKSGFTPLDSDLIRPPRVAESPASFECRVNQIIELGEEGGAGNLMISEIVKIHLNNDFLDDNGQPDIHKLDLVGRNGGEWYTRASGNALFEVPKPTREHGMGVDALPEHVRNSTVLTGNDLGLLGGLPEPPDENAVQNLIKSEAFILLQDRFQGEEFRSKVHEIASELIRNGEREQALTYLLAYESD